VSTSAVPVVRPWAGALSVARWGALAVFAGLILGRAAAGNTALVIVLALGVTFAVTVGLRPSAILVPLGAAAFVENIQIGGATISRFVAAIALFLVLAEVARGKASILPRAPLYWVTGYAIWALASQLWTVSEHRTYIGLSSLAVSSTFALALAALIRSRRDLELALYGIAFGAATVGMISIALFITGGGGRAAGFAGDPNFFAAYQVFAFPVLLALSAQASRRWVRLLLLAGVVSVIGATFTTLSRGGILSLILIGVLLLVLPARSVFRSFGQKTLATFVITIGVGLAITVSYSELSQRINTLVTGKEAAGSGRVNEWKGAWRSAHERPVFGLGFGAFPAVSNDLVRTTPGTDLYHFDERPLGVFVHNAYLGSLAEVGIPGLALFVGLMGSTALALRRAAAQAKRVGDLPLARIANALLISLAGWAFASIFLSSETARPFWITIGIALALPKLIHPRPQHLEAQAQ
jgi:O-antigen ligase